ncbi:MAG: hypothetical protein ACI867_001311 [Glaciecola sp.]|jgi:hypothetical protein
MIGVRLHGGLGNQLFQYAAARRLALHHSTELVLNTRIVAGRSARSYVLGDLRINARVDRTGWATKDTLLHRRGPLRTLDVIGEDESDAHDPGRWLIELPDNVLLHGYWQKQQFFEEIRPTLLDEFRLAGTSPVASVPTGGPPIVAVHVRRGDYVSDPVVQRKHGTLGLDYYERALEFVLAREPEARPWIFSDDPSWCREHLRLHPEQRIISDGSMSATAELDLMRACRHHIMANSTFSWWGAWLARRDGQVAVVPRQWFADVDADEQGLVAPGWVQL